VCESRLRADAACGVASGSIARRLRRVAVTVTVTGPGGVTSLSVFRTVALRHPHIGGPHCEGNALVGRLSVAADGSVATS
jgi:hypothetical protein